MKSVINFKPLVCIFAHPDDEAFGPGGSIAKFASERDVYIICVTDGNAGKNSSTQKRLAQVREIELQKSAQILGVKKVIFLSFQDGTLCNNFYHDIAQKLEDNLNKIKPDTLLTFNQNGISGHLDHIAISFITAFVFQKLKFVKTLLYWCEKKEMLKSMKNYFIYIPPGFGREEVDLIIDTKDFWDVKVKAMHAHASQIHDIDWILPRQLQTPKQEYFLVLKKP